MDAYGVFEGGGARGFAHIGALHAAEGRGIKFRAVAGTSFGAIIAALIAAGYTGSELFHEDDQGIPQGLLAEDLVKRLLDKKEYERIRAWQKWRRLARARDWLSKYRWGKACADVCSALARRTRRWLFQHIHLTCALLVVTSVIVWPRHGRLFRDVWSRLGATDTQLFRDWLGEQLRVKLGLPCGEVAKFRDLRVKLRIVAADLSQSKIHVFGGRGFEEMAVAEAVSASVSFPFFFRPVKIDESMFVDGGLVSNFPAWVLDDLRAQETRSYPTFGFRLLDPLEQITEDPALVWLIKRLIATALDSRQSLESRQIDDYHPIELRTHIRTLDFHLLNEEGGKLVSEGRRGVEHYFISQIGPRDPAEMEKALRGLADLAQEITNAEKTVRAYIIQRTADQYACRVMYSALMEGDADDALLIRWGTPSQALCLQMREPVLMRVNDVPERDRMQSTTKYLHAMRPSDVSHVYCVPIFRSPSDWSMSNPLARMEPLAAFCVDFREFDDGRLLDLHIEDWMAALAQSAGEFWLGRELTGIPELFNGAFDPSSDWTPVASTEGYYCSARKVRGPLKKDDNAKLDSVIKRFK